MGISTSKVLSAALLASGLLFLAGIARGDNPAVAPVGDASIAAQNPVAEAINSAPSSRGDGCCTDNAYGFYGEFLLLCPRNEGIEYAVPINGPIAAGAIPLQDGPTGVINTTYATGFRVGFDLVVNKCGSISADYTNFRSSASDSISTNAPLVIHSMVFNPSSADAAANWLSAGANETTDFDLVDVAYDYNLFSDECGKIGCLIGARYAHLGQQFHADFENVISETVDTNVNFDGAGVRVGLDSEYRLNHGFFFQTKATASLLGGECRASFQQASSTDPNIANTTWGQAQFVGILDGEVNLGWESLNKHVRATVGYTLSDWLNVVKPSDFIASVQANQYRGPNQMGQTSLFFDGLKVRLELDW